METIVIAVMIGLFLLIFVPMALVPLLVAASKPAPRPLRPEKGLSVIPGGGVKGNIAENVERRPEPAYVTELEWYRPHAA